MGKTPCKRCKKRKGPSTSQAVAATTVSLAILLGPYAHELVKLIN